MGRSSSCKFSASEFFDGAGQSSTGPPCCYHPLLHISTYIHTYICAELDIKRSNFFEFSPVIYISGGAPLLTPGRLRKYCPNFSMVLGGGFGAEYVHLFIFFRCQLEMKKKFKPSKQVGTHHYDNKSWNINGG